MSAAFQLQPTGDPAPCSFPRCTLDAFHDGDHLFAAPPKRDQSKPYTWTCAICSKRMLGYGEHALYLGYRTCGAIECVMELGRRDRGGLPLIAPLACECAQRPYPHELAVHAELKHESFNPRLRWRWPWVLMQSERVEPSTERPLRG